MSKLTKYIEKSASVTSDVIFSLIIFVAATVIANLALGLPIISLIPFKPYVAGAIGAFLGLVFYYRARRNLTKANPFA